MLFITLSITLAYLACRAGAHTPEAHGETSGKRTTNPGSLVVDLGYEQYRGYHNASFGLNTWLGIRYAAPPIGGLRWRAPLPPKANREQVLEANVLPPRCPQGPQAPIAPSYNYTGSEDCLFLSVYSPANATGPLPVFLWMHGGGYGGGRGDQDVGNISAINHNGFVSVVIQYRLGAFGFLSSDEVHSFGDVNAGLLDQHATLKWYAFNPDRLTKALIANAAGAVGCNNTFTCSAVILEGLLSPARVQGLEQ